MRQIEMKDLLTYRFLSGVEWAPGGKRAAFVVSNAAADEKGYESRLYLYEAGKVRQLTDLGKEDSFVWEDGETLLLPAVRTEEEKKRAEEGAPFTSFYRLNVFGGEAVHAFTLPVKCGEMKRLGGGRFAFTAPADKANADIAFADDDAKKEYYRKKGEEKDYEVLDEIPFYMNGAGFINGIRRALYTVNADGSGLRRISSDGATVNCFCCEGEEIWFTETLYESRMPIQGCTLRRADAKGEAVTAFTDGEISISDVFAMNGEVYFTGTDGKIAGLNQNDWVYRLREGKAQAVSRQEYSMYGSVGSDVRLGGGSERAVRGGSFFYVTTREGNAPIAAMDADGNERIVLDREGSADCFALCEEEGEMLVIGLYGMALQELYALDTATGAMRQVTHFNDAALEDRYVAKPVPVGVESEGLSIGGWVLLPKDYDPSRKYPAVLDVHGGPKTVYGPVFYHEMQVFASMGYFVLFANPKGGDGRDNAFMDIRGEYGETDYRNLMDFTDECLKRFPAIDAGRVCETGGSYGGFMTNWIITHTDRFCCAASQRSISNWLSFYGTSDIGYFFATDQNAADITKDPRKMWERSPLAYAANVKTPTLFIHSDKDYRCPLEQGMQMFTALADRGVPARMCLFHDETHELSRSGMPRHRLRRLKEITDWFEKYAK